MGMTDWDALPLEVRDLARAGSFQGVGAGRHTAQPAGWWARLIGLDVPQVLPLLQALKDNRILDAAEPGSKYYFTAGGNEWAVTLVELQSIESDPLGPPDLVMIARSASSAHEVLVAAAPFCPNLVIHRNALFHAVESKPPAPLHELAHALLTLDAMAIAAVNGSLGARPDKWVTQHCLENNRGSLTFKPKDKGTESSPRRRIILNGQSVTMHEHFSMGSGPPHRCISLYFIRFPGNSPRITIGYCGPHL